MRGTMVLLMDKETLMETTGHRDSPIKTISAITINSREIIHSADRTKKLKERGITTTESNSSTETKITTRILAKTISMIETRTNTKIRIGTRRISITIRTTNLLTTSHLR